MGNGPKETKRDSSNTTLNVLSDGTFDDDVSFSGLQNMTSEGDDSISGFFTLPDVDEPHDSRAVMKTIPFASNRYQIETLLGEGGMSQVYRVEDLVLNRSVAMKVIRTELSLKPEAENKFYEEAQATAQLQHPSIVPVYDMGKLPNGLLYFTMKEVKGHTLRDVMSELHHYRIGSQWNETPNGWTLRRLVNAILQICEAMGHAHQYGVIHRDLKPENIMLGPYSEVMVLDWGIAKIKQLAVQQENNDPQSTITLSRGTSTSKHGMVAGTPAYMAPEQARGKVEEIGPCSDIYALGGILYELLTGIQPRRGSAKLILGDLMNGKPVEAIPSEPWIPDELAALATSMLRMDHKARPQNIGLVSRALLRWLDGAERRERALELVQKANAIRSEVADASLRADQLEAISIRESARIPLYAGVEHRRPLWKKQDAAKKSRSKSQMLELEMLERLRTALNYDNHCIPAHLGLSEYYYQRHRYFEARHMQEEAQTYEVLLRNHDQGKYKAYLEGLGTLSVHTEGSAKATLYRYILHDRRLELEHVGMDSGFQDFGWVDLPIDNHPLPMGSYLLEIKCDGYLPMKMPINIERDHHFEVKAPNEGHRRPLRLLRSEEVGKDECYVPQGWATIGSNENPDNQMRQVWVDGFVMQKYHITNRQYIDFLNALAAEGRLEEAKEYSPSYTQAGQLQYIYKLNDVDGVWKFTIAPDPHGDEWDLDWPVILVSYHCAMAYAEWYSAKTGQYWRLPTSHEWEKAARGVDGRYYPWGDHFEAIWARVRESVRPTERPLPAKVTDYDLDVSPYGIHGLGGNAQDWCSDMNHDSTTAPIRGSAWSHNHAFVPLHLFRVVNKSGRTETASFRLVRSID